MTHALNKLTIKGFKSIRSLDDFELTLSDGTTIFQRLSRDELSSWLEDYSLGDLWRKNIVTGGPVHE